jgi:rubrerythrin
MDDERRLRGLRAILEQIQDRVRYALKELDDAELPRSMHWKCTVCGHTKHFTKPVPAEVAPPCPKCKGQAFASL